MTTILHTCDAPGGLRAAWRLTAAIAIVFAACGESDSGDPQEPAEEASPELVRVDAWSASPESPECTPAIEEGVLELETSRCDPFVVQQPLQRAIAAGDTLRLLGSHSTLVADTPGEGRLTIRVDGTDLLTYTTPIPANGAFLILEATSPIAAPIGATLQAEVVNHGANSWRVQQISVGR